MKIRTFLGNFFAQIPEHQMWAALSRFGLIDVTTEPKEGEMLLGRLTRSERKLLSMIAHLQVQSDGLGAKALEADLFMRLRVRFGGSLVIRKGFSVYSSFEGSPRYPELDLHFSLAGLREKYAAKQKKDRSETAVINELHNDVSPEFNPLGLELEIEETKEEPFLGPYPQVIYDRFLYNMGM